MISSASDDLQEVTPGEEQAWNEHQLATEVLKPRFRVWAYRASGVVLGCSQRGQFAAQEVVRRAGIGLVERRAGGGAVLAGPWLLGVSVVLPAAHGLVDTGLVPSYRWLGELHASALRDLGIEALAVSPADVRGVKPDTADSALNWACFGSLSPWEVVVGTRKIVGLAQVRRRTGVLFVSGTFLASPQWELLCRALGRHDREAGMLAERTSSCADALQRPVSANEVGCRLARALREAVGGVVPSSHLAISSSVPWAKRGTG